MNKFTPVVTGMENAIKSSSQREEVNGSTEFVLEMAGNHHRNDESTGSEKSKTQVVEKKVFKFCRVVQAQHPQKPHR